MGKLTTIAEEAINDSLYFTAFCSFSPVRSKVLKLLRNFIYIHPVF